MSLRNPLNRIVNIASGKAPSSISKYLAGGNLTALKKGKPDSPDIRPIAVGEVCMPSKCLCAVTQKNAASFFQWCCMSFRE